MVEQEKEVVEDGRTTKVKEMVYEYEKEMESSYRASLIKSFKKTITDGYFPFIIVDNVNEKVKYFGEMWSFAKQNGFQVNNQIQLRENQNSLNPRKTSNVPLISFRSTYANWIWTLKSVPPGTFTDVRSGRLRIAWPHGNRHPHIILY